jgi:hypothetical protein
MEEIEMKKFLLEGFDREIKEAENNYNLWIGNEQKDRNFRKYFENSKDFKKYIELKEKSKIFGNENNDYFKIKRIKQKKQYVSSNHFDFKVSDIEQAKKYILSIDKEFNDFKKIEEHFIIEKANDMRTEEFKEKLLEDGDIDFSGKNCDDCSGWDGSGRCNCGNRRVMWENDEECYFLDDYAKFYAQAY